MFVVQYVTMYRDGDTQPHEDKEVVAVFDSKEMAESWTKSKVLCQCCEHWYEICEAALNPTKEDT